MTTDYHASPTNMKRRGSAHTGVAHWKGQRLSALALIFFCGWFLTEILVHTQSDYHTVLTWFAQPWVGAALSIFVALVFYHSALGLQVIIEDYIPNLSWQSTLIITIKAASAILTILSWFFIIRIAVLGRG